MDKVEERAEDEEEEEEEEEDEINKVQDLLTMPPCGSTWHVTFLLNDCSLGHIEQI